MQELWKKYKSMILYIVFGVGTTLVNIVSYWICAHPFRMATMPSTVIAWITSVLFAYVTNRIWVFESENKGILPVLKEIVSFTVCRLSTGILDMAIMFVFVDLLGINDMIIKVLSNVIVIVLNYILSKLVIFKKKEA